MDKSGIFGRFCAGFSLKSVLVSLPLFCLPAVAQAQNLPLLPQDSRIQKGVFANGLNYYVTGNDRIGGVASFAFVVKGLPDSTDADAAIISGNRRRLGNRSVRDFMIAGGIASSGSGYVYSTGDATLAVFPDVLLKTPQSLDSLLLVLSDTADGLFSATDSEGYSLCRSGDCAIIISGDMDAKSVIAKLQSMLLMVPPPANPRPAAEKHPRQDGFEPLHRISDDSYSVTYRFPRIPQELMGTIHFAVIRKMVGQLSALVRDKVVRLAESEGKPVPNLAVVYESSADGPGAESLTFRVSADSSALNDAKELLLCSLGETSRGAISGDEAVLSSKAYVKSLRDAAASGSRTNDGYLSLCAASFLYGAPMSSDSQLLAFNTSRHVRDTVELRVVKRFASAMMGRDTLLNSYRTPEHISELAVDQNDTLLLPVAVDRKKFSPRISTDPLSKGHVWKFPNGVRVIYKKMNTDGRLYWAICLNGGYGQIASLPEDKAAELEEIFREKISISGIPSDKFRYLALYKGLTIQPRIDFSVTQISGEADSDQAEFLFKTVLGICNEGDLDVSSLRDSTLVADAYSCISSRFRKMNDGVIVLVGDIDADGLRKRITPYIKQLHTSPTAAAHRASRPETRLRRASETVRTDRDGIVTRLAADIPLTAENYYSAALAMMFLHQRTALALSDSGLSADIRWDFSTRPVDRFTLDLIVSAQESRLPESAADRDAYLRKYYDRVRRCIDSMADDPIDAATLAALKKVLVTNHNNLRNSPLYWRDAIIRRYVDAKDFETGAEDKINAVSADKVVRIFGRLKEGTRLETVYVNGSTADADGGSTDSVTAK